MADEATGARMAPAGRANAPGLYDSNFEHDACGVGFVADLTGRCDHDIVAKALTVLRNLDHPGATGRDPKTCVGAGLITQIHDAAYRVAGGLARPAPSAHPARQ